MAAFRQKFCTVFNWSSGVWANGSSGVWANFLCSPVTQVKLTFTFALGRHAHADYNLKKTKQNDLGKHHACYKTKKATGKLQYLRLQGIVFYIICQLYSFVKDKWHVL